MDRGKREIMAGAIARSAAEEPARWRRGTANVVLALAASAALVPLVMTGGSAAAVADVAGNIGAGALSAIIDRAITRLRKGSKNPQPDELREELVVELLAALKQQDSAARELQTELFELLSQIDGAEAAINAVGDEIRDHLTECFSALARQQDDVREKLDTINARQRRQERRQLSDATMLEELVDRARRSRSSSPRTAEGASPAPTLAAGSVGTGPLIVPIGVACAGDQSWTGGAEVTVGARVYLLHTGFTTEHISPDGSTLLRQARALRLIPAGRAGQENAWLRQAEIRHNNPAARRALTALVAERDLLARLGPARGLPRAAGMTADGRVATLVLGWPAARSGGPCDTLQTGLDTHAAQMDSWHMFRLLSGLAGLYDTLAGLHEAGAAHRNLTPSGIIVLDDGRLVLRDLGLAAHAYQPGESSGDYLAPEQRWSARGRPGPSADVYQLAAIAYHLLAGHPPHPRFPLPLSGLAADLPTRLGAGLDAALGADPAARPGARSLSRALRLACDDLS